MVADLNLKIKEYKWEVPRAIAMIAMAAAAIAACARLVDLLYPPKPQTINVHLDQPLTAPAPAK